MRRRSIDPRSKLLELSRELFTNRNADQRALFVMMMSGTELGRGATVGVGHRSRQNDLTEVLQKVVLAARQQFIDFLGRFILILLEEIQRIVLHRSGIVMDVEHTPGLLTIVGRKCRSSDSSALAAVLVVQRIGKGLIIVEGLDALLVENAQNASVALINKVQNVLIVRELDELPRDALPLVLGLLQLEYEAIELLLERFVGVVDAKLLKAVGLERFESKDVEHGNKGGSLRGRGGADGIR
mmetsp:Transcript_31764/g.93230  ORF Transcript_31764/g.93230 Transcript_31764/m.93230 type:complete len:241 (-) Transcript_31764:1011-1733(-)